MFSYVVFLSLLVSVLANEHFDEEHTDGDHAKAPTAEEQIHNTLNVMDSHWNSGNLTDLVEKMYLPDAKLNVNVNTTLAGRMEILAAFKELYRRGIKGLNRTILFVNNVYNSLAAVGMIVQMYADPERKQLLGNGLYRAVLTHDDKHGWRVKVGELFY